MPTPFPHETTSTPSPPPPSFSSECRRDGEVVEGLEPGGSVQNGCEFCECFDGQVFCYYADCGPTMCWDSLPTHTTHTHTHTSLIPSPPPPLPHASHTALPVCVNDSFCHCTPPLLDTSREPNEAGTSCSVLTPSVPGSGPTPTGRDNSIYTAHPDTASLHNVACPASGDHDDRGLRGRHHQLHCCHFSRQSSADPFSTRDDVNP